MILAHPPHTPEMLGLLSMALVLSTAVGLERQLKNKSAGIRTHTLVGVGAALFMVVSKYGFTDVVREGLVTLDPSRVAAQIVSGIGFIGAGLVFVRRNMVHGLTTAASIWLTAAIGTACGAGLIWPALFVTGCHILIVRAWPSVFRRAHVPTNQTALSVRYIDGTGALRRVLEVVAEEGFDLRGFTSHPTRRQEFLQQEDGATQTTTLLRLVDVELDLHGKLPIGGLVSHVGRVDDVLQVRVRDQAD
ncbi:MgtC/SapB family protein [Flexivirga meconopsidis]|uniref:MgtC/SapB family protein n=1 Tax=Flexivirga meconopsidis TaxID=2977121 RepID=UPI00223F5266|nr:MgtC/SapB family protein [Flexivirga meconopsidis]